MLKVRQNLASVCGSVREGRRYRSQPARPLITTSSSYWASARRPAGTPRPFRPAPAASPTTYGCRCAGRTSDRRRFPVRSVARITGHHVNERRGVATGVGGRQRADLMPCPSALAGASGSQGRRRVRLPHTRPAFSGISPGLVASHVQDRRTMTHIIANNRDPQART